MNILKTHPELAALFFLIGGISIMQAGNKAPQPTPKSDSAKSVFVMPLNTSQGRDPFFPESTRVYDQMLAATHTNQVVEMPPLTVPGISGTPGNMLAIINNHTFAEGDQGDVLTSSGKRVHIRCIEIDSDHVIVEVNGHQHRLNLENQ